MSFYFLKKKLLKTNDFINKTIIKISNNLSFIVIIQLTFQNSYQIFKKNKFFYFWIWLTHFAFNCVFWKSIYTHQIKLHSRLNNLLTHDKF